MYKAIFLSLRDDQNAGRILGGNGRIGVNISTEMLRTSSLFWD